MKEGTSRWHLPRIPLYVCQAWIVCTVITLAVLYSEASAFKGAHRHAILCVTVLLGT